MNNSKECKGIFGKIFGHKYQGRYSYVFPSHLAKIKGEGDIDSLKEKRYEYDVCVRCGDVVKK